MKQKFPNNIEENLRNILEEANKKISIPKNKIILEENLNHNLEGYNVELNEEDLYTNTENNENLDENIQKEENNEKKISPKVNFNEKKEKVRDITSLSIEERFKIKRLEVLNVKENPLLNYRPPGIYVRLPSNGNFSRPEDIDFTSSGEVEVKSMTAKDELWLKNPESLLNGESIENIIKNCCPNVKNVKNLPINDIAVLLIAIKKATYGNILELSSECPKCKTENNFEIKIDEILDMMEFLEPEYVVELNNGIKVYCRPHTYEISVQGAIFSFEKTKLVQYLEEDKEMKEEEKIKLMNEVINEIQEMAFWIQSHSIEKVVTPDKKVFQKFELIYDWLRNLDVKSYNKIRNKIEEINNIGIPNSVNITCANEKCKHVFPVQITYDPTNFFD